MTKNEFISQRKSKLPKKIYEDIQLNSKVGDVHVKQVQSGTFTVKIDTGELVIERLQTKKLNAESKTGAMDIQLSGGQIQLGTASGDIKVRTDKVDESITTNTQAGDISLLVANSPSAMQGEFGSKIGDISVNMPNFQFNQISDNLKKGFIGSGGPLVQLTSKYGDIEMKVGK
jgi:lia operon protein LiaG